MSIACGPSGDDEITPPVREAVSARGGDAAQALLGALVRELTGAMEDAGAAGAVDFCSTRALDLTGGIAEAHALEIKRTSMRYRNPANAPDVWERQGLERLEEAVTAGERPEDPR